MSFSFTQENYLDVHWRGDKVCLRAYLVAVAKGKIAFCLAHR
jgi:hypothetical protein